MDVGFETGGGYRVIELSLDCTTVESYIPRSGERGAAFLERRPNFRSVPRFSRFASVSPSRECRDRESRSRLSRAQGRRARHAGAPRGSRARGFALSPVTAYASLKTLVTITPIAVRTLTVTLCLWRVAEARGP